MGLLTGLLKILSGMAAEEDTEQQYFNQYQYTDEYGNVHWSTSDEDEE